VRQLAGSIFYLSPDGKLNMEIDCLIFSWIKECFHRALRVCLLDNHFVNNLRAKRIINKIKPRFALSIIPVCQLKAVSGIF
jgi:hypothetical protein